MNKKPHNVNILTLDELDSKEINHIIDLAIDLKKQQKKDKEKPLLQNKTLAMIFEKPSTRTRVSFETGMFQLGGHALTLSPNDLQLSRGESIEDTAKVLSRYVNVIMARVYDHKSLETLARYASIPVINGLSDSFHPCQILADLMTIKEHKKNLKKVKVAWIGDGNNVCNSWIHSSLHFDFNFNISCPKGCFPEKKLLKKINSKKIRLFENPFKAVENADVIITDTWISMGMKEDKKRLKKFKNFQINNSLFKKTNKSTYFLHCLPAHRGYEVTDEIIDGQKSLVWVEAENRLYVHQSILLWCLEGQ